MLYKRARITKAGGRCEFVTMRSQDNKLVDVRCPRTRYLCVHHNTYERLGREYPGDTDVYCWAHHMIEHLLWESCTICRQPCLLNPAAAEDWFAIRMTTMGIDLDHGSVNWKRLPNKEVFIRQVGRLCANCHHRISKDD